MQHLKASDRDIAFVFQSFSLYPHMTVYENIAFPLRATRMSKAEVDSEVRAVAKTLRITHLLDKKPSALSGGDMQRVAIGRALVRRPKAMLMDEPIGALDAKLREEMRAEIKRLHLKQGSTTIYVTHDQIEAMSLADRIVIMHEGVLQQVGSPTEVYAHPANLFVAQFVGSPVMNVADGRRVARRRRRGAVTVEGAAEGFAFPARAARQARAARPATATVARHPAGGRAGRARGRATATCRSRRTSSSRSARYDIVDLKVGAQMLRARTASRASSRKRRRRGSVCPIDPGRRRISSTRRSGEISLGVRLLSRALTWPISSSRTSPRSSAATPRCRASTSTSPTASSSCCSARPAPARRRRCA